MNFELHMISGEVLVFPEQPVTTKDFEKAQQLALKSDCFIRINCTNGDFLINPKDISYIHITPDEPLELDQRKG